MTHLYAYVKEGYPADVLGRLVAGMKQAVTEGLNLRDTGSTIAVKELGDSEHSGNLGVLVLVYTAGGKGFGVRKTFARLLHESIAGALGDPGEVKMIIKEHNSDMVGLGGVLRSRSTAAADYEES